MSNFSLSNKCCKEETEFKAFNDTLLSIKSQCMRKIRESRHFGPVVETETIEGDGGLFTMFSCERVQRSKTVFICTLDCAAQKLGLVNICNFPVYRFVNILTFHRLLKVAFTM